MFFAFDLSWFSTCSHVKILFHRFKMCVWAFQSNLIWILKKPSVVTFNFKGESLFGYFFKTYLFLLMIISPCTTIINFIYQILSFIFVVLSANRMDPLSTKAATGILCGGPNGHRRGPPLPVCPDIQRECRHLAHKVRRWRLRGRLSCYNTFPHVLPQMSRTRLKAWLLWNIQGLKLTFAFGACVWN